MSESTRANIVATVIEVGGLLVLTESSGPLLEVVRAAGGVTTELFSAIALAAVANGALLTGIMFSRVAYGMARDGLLPRSLAKVLPGRRAPWAAIAATTVPSLLLALTGDVSTLASTPAPLLLVVLLLVNTSLLVLAVGAGLGVVAAVRSRRTP